MKYILIACLFVSFLSISIVPSYAEAPVLNREQIFESDLDSWIDRLKHDESGNKEAIVILDINNKYSYGCLMFQYDTFVEQSKKYDIDGEIMSCKTQTKIAKTMIQDSYDNWKHWYNSVTKKTAGYPPKY